MFRIPLYACRYNTKSHAARLLCVSAAEENRPDVSDDAAEPTAVRGRGLRHRGGRQVLRVRVGRGQPGADRVRRGPVVGLPGNAAHGGVVRVHETGRAVRGAGPGRLRRGGADRHVPVRRPGVHHTHRVPAQRGRRQDIRLGRQTGNVGK